MAVQNTDTPQLLQYLQNQLLDTTAFIKRTENSMEILDENDDFSQALNEVIEMKKNDLLTYELRYDWLQSQIDELLKDNVDLFKGLPKRETRVNHFGRVITT